MGFQYINKELKNTVTDNIDNVNEEVKKEKEKENIIKCNYN